MHVPDRREPSPKPAEMQRVRHGTRGAAMRDNKLHFSKVTPAKRGDVVKELDSQQQQLSCNLNLGASSLKAIITEQLKQFDDSCRSKTPEIRDVEREFFSPKQLFGFLIKQTTAVLREKPEILFMEEADKQQALEVTVNKFVEDHFEGIDLDDGATQFWIGSLTRNTLSYATRNLELLSHDDLLSLPTESGIVSMSFEKFDLDGLDEFDGILKSVLSAHRTHKPSAGHLTRYDLVSDEKVLPLLAKIKAHCDENRILMDRGGRSQASTLYLSSSEASLWSELISGVADELKSDVDKANEFIKDYAPPYDMVKE